MPAQEARLAREPEPGDLPCLTDRPCHRLGAAHLVFPALAATSAPRLGPAETWTHICLLCLPPLSPFRPPQFPRARSENQVSGRHLLHRLRCSYAEGCGSYKLSPISLLPLYFRERSPCFSWQLAAGCPDEDNIPSSLEGPGEHVLVSRREWKSHLQFWLCLQNKGTRPPLFLPCSRLVARWV